MSAQEMPEWLEQYLIDGTGYKPIGHLNYEYPTNTIESEAVLEFYDFISKPENLAKFPEVAKLIEALDTSHLLVCNDDPNDRCYICKALKPFELSGNSGELNKPFKKEGSDEF